MNTTTLPTIVYFQTGSEDILQTKRDRFISGLNKTCHVDTVGNWSDLSAVLTRDVHSVIFNIGSIHRNGGSISEFMMMVETMIKYTDRLKKINVAICINADTSVATIKEIQKTNVRAIVPDTGSWATEETLNAVIALITDQRYFPKHIISQLPGAVKKTANKNHHSLTGRQQEVFDLIANRGLSNKQIARVLNISESTVKIHVSAVMKNLCVRNRTQLALTK